MKQQQQKQKITMKIKQKRGVIIRDIRFFFNHLYIYPKE